MKGISFHIFSSVSIHTFTYISLNIVNCRLNPLVIDIVVWISTAERYMSVDFQFGLNVSRNQIVTRYRNKINIFLCAQLKSNVRALYISLKSIAHKLLQILVSLYFFLKILFTTTVTARFPKQCILLVIFLLVSLSFTAQRTPSMYDDVLRA
jgi:hypothetical protein